ncbi:enoyl-CoA hydratase [Kutzneria buriramensis]|uniref:enoyl-CoA hydratase n=1 Tax=Kutzneria buriramensis TaxID=1045776 RepID=A0A3E0GYE7_9PSEU|nr:enoyl-CoA hydratase/isomerase family protein [Kutzneria buriramensis]REH32570.1 enoyl-CoA hydratase [Kutzneria buriramensis]
MGVTTTPLVRLLVDGGIGTIMVDRPPVNALSVAAQADLRAVATQAAERDDVRAVVVTGGRRIFSAGADIREMAEMSHAEMADHAPRLQAAFDAVARIPKPVVAAVNGYALGGGCELALAADRRICTPQARLGLPEILLGVIPGAGGTQRLTRLVGPAKAKDLLFTGRQLDAVEALEIGLVDEIVDEADLVPAARRWAEQFVSGPAAALRAAKAAVDVGAGLPMAEALDWETSLFSDLFGTEDRLIGMRSFVTDGAGRARFVGR